MNAPCTHLTTAATFRWAYIKGKGSPYSIAERRVPQLIPVLGSQPAGDVSHKPGNDQVSKVTRI